MAQQALTVGDVKSTLEIVEGIAAEFSKLAKAAGDNEEVQMALDAAWQKVQMLERINMKMDAIVAGAQAAMAEIARQRDFAVVEAKRWQRAGDELAMRILAGKIAVDGNIPVTDVVRVLEVLSGKKTTFEEPRLQSLYEEIQELADRLLEEQVFEAAEDE